MTMATYRAALDDLYTMLGAVREAAAAAGLDSTKCSAFELAAEEALVNIIQYAYPHTPGTIDLEWEHFDDLDDDLRVFALTISDDGIPYNPLQHAATLRSNLDKDNIGGYGVLYILNLMDQVQYHHDGKRNRLTLLKRY